MSEGLHKNPAIAAGQLLNGAGCQIDVRKVFEMADFCDYPAEDISIDWVFPSGLIRIKQPHPLNRYRWPGKQRGTQ